MDDLISEYKEVFEGIPWHSESIMESIEKVPLEYYDQKLAGAHHTIGELIQHMIDWRIFVMEKIKKNEAFDIVINTPSDWKEIVQVSTEDDKINLLHQLKATQAQILELFSRLKEEDLTEIVYGKPYNIHYMIKGIIDHDIYHQGQINLMRIIFDSQA